MKSDQIPRIGYDPNAFDERYAEMAEIRWLMAALSAEDDDLARFREVWEQLPGGARSTFQASSA